MSRKDQSSIKHQAAQFLRSDFSGQVFDNWPTHPPEVIPLLNPDDYPASVTAALDTVRTNYSNLYFSAMKFIGHGDPSTWNVTHFAVNPDSEAVLGSLGKIMILYAAFQLREDVRAMLRRPGVNPANVRAKLQEGWANSIWPDLGRLANEVKDPSAPPFLDRIFTFGPSGPDFQGMDGCGVKQFLATAADISAAPRSVLNPDVARNLGDVHHKEHEGHPSDRWSSLIDPDPKLSLPFAQRLWLTTRWSDNAAATTCAVEIGLPYINALMRGAGLYTDSFGGRGMRLYEAYEDPPHRDPNFKWWFDKFGAYFAYHPAGGPSSNLQAGTARSLAALLAALVRQKLISQAVSIEMASFVRCLTSSDFQPIGSYVEWSLRDQLPPYNNYGDLWSKLGIDDPYEVDWAYLQYSSVASSSPENRLGLVILNYTGPDLGDPANKNAEFHQCVRDLFSAFDALS